MKIKNFILKHQRIFAVAACLADCLIDYLIAQIFNWSFLSVYTVDTFTTIGILLILMAIKNIKFKRYIKSVKCQADFCCLKNTAV